MNYDNRYYRVVGRAYGKIVASEKLDAHDGILTFFAAQRSMDGVRLFVHATDITDRVMDAHGKFAMQVDTASDYWRRAPKHLLEKYKKAVTMNGDASLLQSD